MIGALVPSKVVDTEGQLLDALQEGSEVLQNITDMFAPLMKDFHIFFFWEQEKTNMGFTQDYVRPSSVHLLLGKRLSMLIPGRWSKNLPQHQYWITRSELVFPMIMGTCANLKAGLLLGIDSLWPL